MWYETLLKLMLAVVLSGAIGFERENLNRPAGLRTHVLVCVGAAIVQITSIQFYRQITGGYTADPFRLGAQVISGIGFLGAGTIIRDGISIKGLTTAAGLWAVACIGLTVGTGLYLESVLATVIVFSTLRGLRFLERWALKNKKHVVIELEIYNSSEKISEVLEIVSKYGMSIQNLMIRNMRDNIAEIAMSVSSEGDIPFAEIMKEIAALTGVKNLEFGK